MPKNNPESPMLVMGLGNPGSTYANTRHNVGYHVTEFLLEKPSVQLRRRLFSSYEDSLILNKDGKRPLYLVRYKGYMNRSGEILPGIIRKKKIPLSDLIVIVDNMDLPAGECRIRKGGGNAGHNGLKSIESALGDSSYIRIYIGVGRPEAGASVVDHVLGEPSDPDMELIRQACIRASLAILDLRSSPFDRVAEGLNRRGN